MVAWECFLQRGEVAPNTVRHLIEDSWWRCRSGGIDPALTQASTLLTEEELMALRSRSRDLIEASVPIMAQARDILSESGTIILTDPRGVILQTEGDPATVDAARRIRHVWQQGMAHLGSPRAHTRQRNVMMPRVSNAVVTSPQLITTESRRMVRVPPRPQCA